MPDVYGPFDGQPWAQSPWYRDAAFRSTSGVFGTAQPNATTAGDLALTVSGLTVTMGVGRAHVSGAGYERTDTGWSTTLPTNTNANPRRDRLVLRRDLGAKTVVPAILQGTPAATPTAPTVTQSDAGVWELPLFSFQVPGGSGTTLTNIVDERAIVSAGQRVGPWISGTLRRTDNTTTLNANATTALSMWSVAPTSSGIWTQYAHASGVGVHCDIPGVYSCDVLLRDDTGANRWQALTAYGSVGFDVDDRAVLGGFSGVGASFEVRSATTGLDLAFSYISNATVAGTIRTGTRYAVRWVRPL